MTRTATRASSTVKRAKVRLVADDGEGAPIDFGAVAGVVVFGAHGRCPFAD